MNIKKRKVLGYLAILFLSGCATQEDVTNLINKNNTSFVKREIATSSTNMKKALTATETKLTQGQQQNAKNIEDLQTTTTEHSTLIKKTSDELNVLLKDFTSLKDKYTKEIKIVLDNIEKQRSALVERNKGLDESLDNFNNTIKEKGQTTDKVIQGLEVFLRRTIANLEQTLKTHTQLLAQVEMQSNINTETLGKIKDLVKTRHSLLISVTKHEIESLKTNLATLEDLGGFLKNGATVPENDNEKESLFQTVEEPSEAAIEEPQTPVEENK